MSFQAKAEVVIDHTMHVDVKCIPAVFFDTFNTPDADSPLSVLPLLFLFFTSKM